MYFVKRVDNEFEMYFGPVSDGQVMVRWGGIEAGICRDNVVYIHKGESLGNLSFCEMVAAQGGVILWDPALKKGRFLVTNHSPTPKRSLVSIYGGRLSFIFIMVAVTAFSFWFYFK